MIKLIYSNYLKDKNFNIDEEYYKLFESKNNNFKKLIKEYPFNVIFCDINFKDILLIKDNNIHILIKKIELRILEQSKIKYKLVKKKKIFIYEVKEKLKNIFNYEGNNQRIKITPFFTNNFNFRTCFYCNKDFITNFNQDDFEETKEVSTFQLDHFYDKATYPYLAFSFYNLIPSCSTCNSSKVKGSENCLNTCKAPNDNKFDFENKVKFKLLLDKNCKNLYIKDKDDIDIPLKEQFSNEYDNYIKVFKLNERYEAHKDIVYEMIIKAELYPQIRLKELQDLTGIPFQQIKKDIFNLIDNDEDLPNKPFSKLIKDISEELELI